MKKENGAIAIFTLLAMLFFLIFVMIIFNNVSEKSQLQTKSTEVIVDEYKADAVSESAYNKIVSENRATSNDVKTEDQNNVIGSSDYVAIDDTIYKAK